MNEHLMIRGSMSYVLNTEALEHSEAGANYHSQLTSTGMIAAANYNDAKRRILIAERHFDASSVDMQTWKYVLRSVQPIESFDTELPPTEVLSSIQKARSLQCFDAIVVYERTGRRKYDKYAFRKNGTGIFFVFGVIKLADKQKMFPIARWNHGELLSEQTVKRLGASLKKSFSLRMGAFSILWYLCTIATAWLIIRLPENPQASKGELFIVVGLIIFEVLCAGVAVFFAIAPSTRFFYPPPTVTIPRKTTNAAFPL